MEKIKKRDSCVGCKSARWINSNEGKLLWCDEVDGKINKYYLTDTIPPNCPKKDLIIETPCKECDEVRVINSPIAGEYIYCEHKGAKAKDVTTFYRFSSSPRSCPKKKVEGEGNNRREKEMEHIKLKRVRGFKDVGCICREDTINDAWEYWYERLVEQAQSDRNQISRDGEVVGEIINAITIVNDPTRFIVTSPIRKMPMRYAVGELLWYLSGNPTLDSIRPFTNAWDRMSDDGETVNSNYGHKIYDFYGFDQWEYVKNCLKKDTLSRQAVIHIKDAKDYMENPTKDMPCTLTLQFLARPDIDGDMRLHLTTNMRSNDIWMGFPYDCFNFCAFLNKMAMEVGFKVGTYTHIAGSLHLYKRDYEKGRANMNVNENKEVDSKVVR